jgi:hypothetical protein
MLAVFVRQLNGALQPLLQHVLGRWQAFVCRKHAREMRPAEPGDLGEILDGQGFFQIVGDVIDHMLHCPVFLAEHRV